MGGSESFPPPPPTAGPSRKGPFLAGFLAIFLPSAVLGALGISRLWTSAPRQPVAFNHRLHGEVAGLACDACHAGFQKEAFSGLPAAADCAGCHGEAQGSSAEERSLVSKLERGEALEWKRLFDQPSDVFFSHRRHVVAGRLACPECHGAIGESTAPPARVRKLSMADCLACHRAAGVSVSCTACHR